MKSLRAKGPNPAASTKAAGRVSRVEGRLDEIYLVGQSEGRKQKKRLCKTERVHHKEAGKLTRS